MFAGLSDSALRRLDARMAEAVVEAGTVFISEHAPAREAFIVIEGQAAIVANGEPVATASAGDLIGELSLLDPGPRTATVVALTPMRMYVLDPREFAVLFDDPESARWIAATLARRLREATHHLENAHA
jgi:CRP/FNR family cyclic AMP-dependent transcriptional regulator